MFKKSLEEFINQQRIKIAEEKLKLANLQNDEKYDYEKPFISNSNCAFEEKENVPSKDSPNSSRDEFTMLKYGEYSPNNPRMRVATQPYLGLGEYEQRKQILLEQRKADYQQYAEKAKHTMNQDNANIRNSFKGSRPVSNTRDKSVQTDIQNVNTQLIQCDVPSQLSREKNKSPRSRGVKIDKVQIETQNNIIFPGHNKYLDKAAAEKNNSPRAKLMADLQSSYFPTLMGYAATNTQEDDRLEKVRRQEKYLTELQQQIEEKQQLMQKHKNEEKLEQEMAARRLESQIRDINLDEKQILGRHSYSTDLPVKEKSDTSFSRANRYKSRMLEGSLTNRSNPTEKKITSKYTNSPPLSRRDKPPYSFNIPSNSVFAKTLPKEKLEQNFRLPVDVSSNLITKESQKRTVSSNTKLEESLPIPVLKAQSPVAKELINAVAVQSRTSDAMRKLEDKWQIPAVQKTTIKNTERPLEGQGILTQLGAIRLQLQQEQLRLDETLRKRGTSQTVVQADVHHNFT